MQGTIKSVKLLNKNDQYGLEIIISTPEGKKIFSKYTDKDSFRKLFFGIMTICNNYDLLNLANIKNTHVSVILNSPDYIYSKIIGIGRKKDFLMVNKEGKYCKEILTNRDIKIYRALQLLLEGNLLFVKSASGTITITVQFKSGSLGFDGPNIYYAMGYPLYFGHEVSPEQLEIILNDSSYFIYYLYRIILGTNYLYNSKNNAQEYEVNYNIDDYGNIISLYSNGTYINKYDDEYTLEDKPINDKQKKLKLY